MPRTSTMFHDAFVNRFTIGTDRLVLETDAFSFSFTEIVPRGRIIISGHQILLKNGEEVSTFDIESDGAEINSLGVSDQEVLLVLFWHSYAPQRSSVCAAYRFPGATLHIEAKDGGHLVSVVS